MNAHAELTALAAANGWKVEPGVWAFETVFRKSRRIYVRVTWDARGRVIEACTAKKNFFGTGKRETVRSILSA